MRTLTYQQVRAQEPEVPTFADVLALAKGHIRVYVDVKQAAATALVDAIRHAAMTSHVVIYGNPNLLAEVTALAPEISVMPESVSVPALRKNLDTLKPRVIAFSDWNWKDEIITLARDAQAAIYVDRLGKADTPSAWQDAIDRGATGIQTNKPAELVAFLRGKGLHP